MFAPPTWEILSETGEYVAWERRETALRVYAARFPTFGVNSRKQSA